MQVLVYHISGVCPSVRHTVNSQKIVVDCVMSWTFAFIIYCYPIVSGSPAYLWFSLGLHPTVGGLAT
jgi:hypothetical protein